MGTSASRALVHSVSGLSPTVLLSSAPRQPGTAVQQPAAVAAVAATTASSPSAEKVWHGWTPFQVGTMCKMPGYHPARHTLACCSRWCLMTCAPASPCWAVTWHPHHAAAGSGEGHPDVWLGRLPHQTPRRRLQDLRRSAAAGEQVEPHILTLATWRSPANFTITSCQG
jgi:hypothetical protein